MHDVYYLIIISCERVFYAPANSKTYPLNYSMNKSSMDIFDQALPSFSNVAQHTEQNSILNPIFRIWKQFVNKPYIHSIASRAEFVGKEKSDSR